MRRIIPGIAVVVLFGLVTMARAAIDESEGQLMARFGAVQTRASERILEQGRVYAVGERLMFRQREWRVTAVLIGGRCAKITYVKHGAWTGRDYAALLSANAGRWTWTEIIGAVPKWQRTWRRSDGMVAKWRYAGGFAIEGQSFVDVCEEVREAARTRVREQGAQTASR